MRTVAMSVFFQGVIMLYLFDFGDTSWMVLGSTVVGFGIECWKLMRALGGKVSWAGWRPTGVDWGGSEASTVSYALSKTAEYDSIATGHLLVVMYPLVAGYAGYSLAYERHRGWYSWVLSSLTSFIYMFGFAQMVPQLYINYRLKSVAAMPWKTMAYKSLNTFIDDLFSFIVKMPMMCVPAGRRRRRRLPFHSLAPPPLSLSRPRAPARTPLAGTAWPAFATTSSSSSTCTSAGCTAWTSRGATSTGSWWGTRRRSSALRAGRAGTAGAASTSCGSRGGQRRAATAFYWGGGGNLE